jgi:K(+)-stimulated pyrophosphate-energized sodium pump
MAKAAYGNAAKMNFEKPLTNLVFLTSFVSIALTYAASYFMLGGTAEDVGAQELGHPGEHR